MPVWLVTMFAGNGWKWIGGALAVAAIIGSIWLYGHNRHASGVNEENARWLKLVADQNEKNRKTENTGVKVINAVAKTTSDKIVEVRESIRTVKEYVYVHPPAAECQFSPFMRRVFDASGTGNPAYLTADGPDIDGTPSPVPCDEAARYIIENNESFRANSEKLVGLQTAYEALRKTYNQGAVNGGGN